jgi:hypothetical protein
MRPSLVNGKRATYAVLDLAGHNLEIEQPALMDTLLRDWLDRISEEAN